MNIENFMRVNDCRLSMTDKWLVYDVCWEVFRHRYASKHLDTIYRGDSLEEALTALKNDD